MVKRIFLLTTIVFFFCLTSQNFSQVKSNKFGFGASVGNVSKVQLSYTLSKQFQISFDLGTFIYSNSDAEVINLGASFKYFFSSSNFSTYLGAGTSVTSIKIKLLLSRFNMNTYTYSEARQKLSMLLNKAKKEGKVIIKRKDGTTFEIKAVTENKSPLDVKGIKLNLKADEIVKYIEDSRSSKY